MFEVLGKNPQSCIYDPDQFRQFCISSGARTIFDNILRSVSTSRRSESRNEKNKKVVVNIIYTLCFALSQQNNYLQLDQTRFFMLKNLNKEAMDTERCLENSCSRRTSYNMRQNINGIYLHGCSKHAETRLEQDVWIHKYLTNNLDEKSIEYRTVVESTILNTFYMLWDQMLHKKCNTYHIGTS